MTIPPAAVAESPLHVTGIRRAVDTVLEDFLQRKAHMAANGHLPGEVTQVLHDFSFAGGKRLRPLLCVTGWHAAAGHGDIRSVIRTAASLEPFHAFALIHDDLMDRSANRRGHPTVHRALATRHHRSRTGARCPLSAVATSVQAIGVTLACSAQTILVPGSKRADG
ncbi:polyprenyl synthetase family protein [Streptomyces sp. NPDC048384]|uniref:polyprenyl synthetase family protein n=1 Tax=Streptomyces sp. NPDC048384 TaxID=3155487 RepID=UPI003447426B